MSNEELRKWITCLNNGRFQESIFLRNISKDVYFGFVWDIDKKKYYSDFDRHQVYFIKSENIFVGCVYYGGEDIHGYTIPKFRKRKLMFRALSETILPHIFYYFCKDEQRITVTSKEGKILALKLRFKSRDGAYFVRSSKFGKYNNPMASESISPITVERYKELRKSLEKAFADIKKVSDELEINYEKAEVFNEIGLYQSRVITKLEDLFYKYS